MGSWSFHSKYSWYKIKFLFLQSILHVCTSLKAFLCEKQANNQISVSRDWNSQSMQGTRATMTITCSYKIRTLMSSYNSYMMQYYQLYSSGTCMLADSTCTQTLLKAHLHATSTTCTWGNPWNSEAVRHNRKFTEAKTSWQSENVPDLTAIQSWCLWIDGWMDPAWIYRICVCVCMHSATHLCTTTSPTYDE